MAQKGQQKKRDLKMCKDWRMIEHKYLRLQSKRLQQIEYAVREKCVKNERGVLATSDAK